MVLNHLLILVLKKLLARRKNTVIIPPCGPTILVGAFLFQRAFCRQVWLSRQVLVDVLRVKQRSFGVLARVGTLYRYGSLVDALQIDLVLVDRRQQQL